jgi:hypothetical protein
MTVSASDLSAYLGPLDPSYAEFVGDCATQANALVAGLIGSQMSALVGSDTAPAIVTVNQTLIDRATLEVGAELFNRRDTKNGFAQFAGTGDNAVRVRIDPLIPARAILAPILAGGFA